MVKEKNTAMNSGKEKNPAQKNTIQRRTILKGLAGLPILGFFGFEVMKKKAYDDVKKNRIISELGLGEMNAPVVFKKSSVSKGDLIKIGIIGFGNRARDDAKSLGFVHPSIYESMKKNNTWDNYMLQEDLNVNIVGICDVFDLNAEYGLEIARNEIRPGGGEGKNLPVKRYSTYQQMLEDKNIDAVIIATPDHHHAIISADAIEAGKHVYCEKSPAITEESMNRVYRAVKNSNKIYQLGHQITQNVVYQQAREIISKGILGKVTLVETTTNRNTAEGAWIRHLDKNGKVKPGDEKSIDWDQWLGTAPKIPFSIERFYNWTKYFDYDIGLIGQLLTHEYDAVNQLLKMGIPKTVTSSGGIYTWKDGRDIPDSLHCTFEYPDHDLTLLYSATLGNSRSRGRVFMGRDASMELGNSITITADRNSEKYAKQIKEGLINPSVPMITINPGSGQIDAVTSASEKYYASRGLTTTNINGRVVDVTHLHIKDWIDCIRNGGTPSGNIDRAFEEGMACIMAHRSYLEKKQMTWDASKRKIV